MPSLCGMHASVWALCRSAAVVALLSDMDSLWATRAQLAERMRRHYEEWVGRPLTPRATGDSETHDMQGVSAFACTQARTHTHDMQGVSAFALASALAAACHAYSPQVHQPSGPCVHSHAACDRHPVYACMHVPSCRLRSQSGSRAPWSTKACQTPPHSPCTAQRAMEA